MSRLNAQQTNDETLELYRQSVRRFLASEFAPQLERWRAQGGIDRSFFLAAGAQGLLCPSVPEAYGGVGGDHRFNVLINNEVARLGVMPASFLVHSDIVANYLLRWGSEAQKQELLPKMVSGETMTGIAMTEPSAGSDLMGIRTTARRVADGYVLNGQKTFITNGQNADIFIVVAKMDEASGRSISLFIVDANAEGFARGRRLSKMGGHEQDTSELFLSDVFVPASARLGEEGQGFAILMSELPTERLSIAVSAVAACELALETTIEYVRSRQAFGRPLIEFQNTAFKLAELRAKVNMARRYVDSCVASYLADELDAVTAAEAKLMTTEIQCAVVDACLQMHGGYGWMDDYLISRLYADARVQRIYGGSDEIMKLIISRDIMGSRPRS